MGIPVKLPDIADWKAQVKCQQGCPAGTDAGRYVQLIAGGDDDAAYLVARAPNPLASICARVCAAPCEDACRRGSIDAPVTIRALKRFVAERYGAEAERPLPLEALFRDGWPEGNRLPGHLPVPRDEAAAGRRVAVVGSGPAGLAAAHDLALLGHDVTVFDAAEEPGGMLRFGIPEYRLPRDVIRAEIARIGGLGVRFALRTPLRPGFGLADLGAQGFEAVFLAVGVGAGRDLPLPGADLPGVIKAIDYLVGVNRGRPVDIGARVLVIGGGFVAFDAARTALRLGGAEPADGGEDVHAAIDAARAALRSGASEVTIVSLETPAEMPVLKSAQGHEEYEEARREGLRFVERRGPRRFVGTDRLEAVELRRALTVFDAAGRFAPTYDDEDILVLPADTCVLAIGQRPDLAFLGPGDGIELGPGGTIAVDRATLATSRPGVYAGGDVAFGPRNLIEAIGDGKRAALAIHRWLSGGAATLKTTVEIEELPTRTYRMIRGYELLDRAAPPTREPAARGRTAEVENRFAEGEARRQAARCLVCHVQTIYDPETCVLCGRCTDVCPEYCLAIVPFDELALDDAARAAVGDRTPAGGAPLSAMVKDDERCVRCGLCALRCPTGAMTMERFTITERIS